MNIPAATVEEDPTDVYYIIQQIVLKYQRLNL